MARRQLVKGWDWVKTERVFLPEPPKKAEAEPMPRRSSNSDALKAVALTTGVVFGLVGLFWYQRKHAPEQSTERMYSGPQVVYVPAPEPEPVRQLEVVAPYKPLAKLQAMSAIFRLLETSPSASVTAMKQVAWEELLPGVAYPGGPQPGDHPSVTLTHRLIWDAISTVADELAREQRAAGEQAAATGSESPATATPPVERPATTIVAMPKPSAVAQQPAAAEQKQLAPDKVAELTSEWPTPGRFCRLDAEHVELGIEHVATQAMAAVVLKAAQREGWTADKAAERARRTMENARVCSDYTKLIEQSQWNAERLHDLRVGQLVWCPPIKTRSLLDRSRQPKAALEQRPWSDGSSRLEPPPTIWAT
jgi:hypothetical protein